MPEGQDAIYYLAGTEGGNLKDSPQLEGFAAKGFEVLLFSDPIDAFWPSRMESYKDKKLKSATQVSDLFAPAEAGEDITALCTALEKALAGKISGAAASTRLTGSPAMLIAAEHGPDLAMQRMLRRAGRPSFGLPPKLEINSTHPLVLALAARAKAEGDLTQDAGLLLDLAKLQEGDLPDNPAEFVKAVAAALAKA
jgi:molecular chaperone HtpG